jgi:protein ImuB
MIVCVHLPRFELVVAAGGPQALAGRALAIAPTVASQCVGEVSGAAEACGVTAGMTLGEALARCPDLGLVAADPLGVAQAWEAAARALEGIGAALELAGVGLAYFHEDGLRRVHGGEHGVIAAARNALARPVRIGVGPTRFCALAAALEVRSRRAVVVDGRGARRYLASQSVDLLRFRAETGALVEPLRRLGIGTLGELTALGADAMADRFGEPGSLARRLACGEDTPLLTRRVEDRLEESLELGESSSGPALERVLGVLVDRLLARPERRGRTLRAAMLSARLVDGGTWHERVVFRQALSDSRRMRLALSLRVALLPAPAEALRLGVDRFGPPDGEQGSLLTASDEPAGARMARLACLREAVNQVRAVAGPEAALRALCVDPESRVPERRVVLTPFPT